MPSAKNKLHGQCLGLGAPRDRSNGALYVCGRTCALILVLLVEVRTA